MFSTIIVLVALILATPNLLGHPSELASLPVLIVAMNHDTTSVIVHVAGAVQAYMYENLSLDVRSLTAGNVSIANYSQNDTYGVQLTVPANLTMPNVTALYIHARLVDRQENFFEANVTMAFDLTDTNGKPVMVFQFPTDLGTPERRVTPPDDFRWVIPRRGLVP